MKIYDKFTPEGTKDVLFEGCVFRKTAEDAVDSVLEKRGFRPVMTPMVEFYDLFGANKYFPQESMYKLIDAKGRILVLRPDSTIPIARLTASKLQNEPDPIRLRYRQSVFRSYPGERGWSDEQAQAGAELIGASGEKADLEMLVTAGDCLRACGAVPFTLEIGHIGIFKYLIEKLTAGEAQKEEIRSLIESKNYTALQDLLAKTGPSETAKALQMLPRLFGGEEVFSAAKALCDDPQFLSILGDLRALYEKMVRVSAGQNIQVDLGMVNQAEYYTGVVFRGYLPGIGEPVLSGGRYDRLLEDYGLHKPAIGFAVQIDAVAEYLERQGGAPRHPTQVLVFWEEAHFARAIEHLSKLESQGIFFESSLHDTREQAEDYAKRKQIPMLQIVTDRVLEQRIMPEDITP